MASVVPSLYKAILRSVREIERGGKPLRVRLPVTLADQTSAFQYIPCVRTAHAPIVAACFPTLADPPTDDPLPPHRLRAIARSEFRAPRPGVSVSERIDFGLQALRELSAQCSLARRGSVARTETGEGVCVECEAHSLFHDGPSEAHWFFQYRIRIANLGDSAIRVIGRHWSIRNSDGSLEAQIPRNSPGIVGETPLLKAGEAFEYFSFTIVQTPGGSMEGCFQCIHLESGRRFDARVAKFPLLVEKP
ncbi:hypothetical protein AB1Y20_012041 [Prymnesium parvum]|uniref:ApaG domain-containing protein n=1 Tax=Prymnesium parvum TaxID=97485 RepID=A0AB34IQM1_PRYPA|eukprot:CAMPEP_0182845972 /NCGR_PEP_ID=MMETSP0006_2-20121128/27634_2 /TAXON_ID=97485 /ORGANISM="Prymnesium parvum, Strain Texoma1" /LENGTH=247 /DNA_ID=CAMNT_0024976123 /DNA_START=447 /DNA_END=1190 /DNA_ORIENTATION=-